MVIGSQSNNNLYTDKELLERVALGEERAFRLLFQNYHNKLGSYVYRYTRSFMLTQEIVQDVFLKIWLNRSALHEINNFNSYLFVVARNHTFNALKRIASEYGRQKQWQRRLIKEEFNLNGQNTAYKETVLAVNKAIETLPAQQKKVFLLSREMELTHEEIALKLRLSVTTVKKHMVLALKQLREQLGADANIILFLVLTRCMDF